LTFPEQGGQIFDVDVKGQKKGASLPLAFIWPGLCEVSLCVAATIKTGGSRPARRLTFFNARKVSKKACSCGGHFLLDRSSRSIHIEFTDQSIAHLHRFTGPLPLAPALRCSAVVFRE